MNEQKRAAGKASVDRPWMNFYPEQMRNLPLPEGSGVSELLKAQNPDMTKPAIEYYGRILTWGELWNLVDKAAKALKTLGFCEGSSIPSFLLSVPEHIILLLAAEKIGAMLLCRDDTPEELACTIRKAQSTVIFAPDYLSKAEEDLFLAETPLERIVKVSPYTYADRNSIPDYIDAQITARYPEELARNPDNLNWDEFLALGDSYVGQVDAPRDRKRPLFGAYTSGSISAPKLVVHSAEGMVGIIYQVAVSMPPADPQLTWLSAICPPALASPRRVPLFPVTDGCCGIPMPFTTLSVLEPGTQRELDYGERGVTAV